MSASSLGTIHIHAAAHKWLIACSLTALALTYAGCYLLGINAWITLGLSVFVFIIMMLLGAIFVATKGEDRNALLSIAGTVVSVLTLVQSAVVASKSSGDPAPKSVFEIVADTQGALAASMKPRADSPSVEVLPREDSVIQTPHPVISEPRSTNGTKRRSGATSRLHPRPSVNIDSLLVDAKSAIELAEWRAGHREDYVEAIQLLETTREKLRPYRDYERIDRTIRQIEDKTVTIRRESAARAPSPPPSRRD